MESGTPNMQFLTANARAKPQLPLGLGPDQDFRESLGDYFPFIVVSLCHLLFRIAHLVQHFLSLPKLEKSTLIKC